MALEKKGKESGDANIETRLNLIMQSHYATFFLLMNNLFSKSRNGTPEQYLFVHLCQ